MIEAPVRYRPGPVVTRPAVASRALSDVVTGPVQRWRLLGASGRAVWCVAGDRVIVVTDDVVARLPNAVIIGFGDDPPMQDGDVLVGGGAVRFGRACLRVVRWWDPGVVPAPTDVGAVAHRLRSIAAGPLDAGEQAVCDMLAAADDSGVVGAAAGLIGRGGGLTPEGDDFLLGAVAGYRHVATAAGDPAGGVRVRTGLLAAARSGTTQLSYALLRHALAGEVPAPVGRLLHALTGRGDVDAALEDTMRIGSSSGRAMARGVLGGAGAACGAAA